MFKVYTIIKYKIQCPNKFVRKICEKMFPQNPFSYQWVESH